MVEAEAEKTVEEERVWCEIFGVKVLDRQLERERCAASKSLHKHHCVSVVLTCGV